MEEKEKEKEEEEEEEAKHINIYVMEWLLLLYSHGMQRKQSWHENKKQWNMKTNLIYNRHINK